MGAILVMPTVRASTRAGEDVTRPETFEMQRRLLGNPLLLRFWTERNRGVISSAERSVQSLRPPLRVD